ncbi:MAG: YkgJ family cysteine cluster protein [Halieaceae bacterium]
MECREGCGACCIAPSIKQPYYGMPEGKPAGVRCVHLDEDLQCMLFGDDRRPGVCADFAAEEEICGVDREEALARLHWLETASEPN